MPESNTPESSLRKLSIYPRSSPSTSSKKLVLESWEDEDVSSGEENRKPLSPQQPANYPSAPPPTPISPSTSFARDTFTNPYGYSVERIRDARTDWTAVRPEKTDAVAKRMVAGALGVKAPKRTEEQRAYDKAIRDKEIKKRNQEKEAAVRAQEESERAKQAVWTD